MSKSKPTEILVILFSHLFAVFFILILLQCDDSSQNTIAPLVRVVDLDIGESKKIVLYDGTQRIVRLIALTEERDDLRDAVRRAKVSLEIDGEKIELVSANYHLPVTIANTQIDCPITKGYLSNSTRDSWGLEKDARLRLWPAGSPLVVPGSFTYPIKQRWFASSTQMSNEPTYVDGGEDPNRKKIYYHNGLDFGGTEGKIVVVSATDGLVVSSGDSVLPGYTDTPVSPRYDVVYILDKRGWYYRYSHMLSIDTSIYPGQTVTLGQPVGILGKEGGSGGWSHLHFDITCRQPSGKWGTQEGYALIWEAYLQQYQPDLVAVARPHHLIWTGDKVELDGSRSWSRNSKISSYKWTFTDGSSAKGEKIERIYQHPGTYSEILEITDQLGHSDYDFSIINVIDPNIPDQLPPTIHLNYAPTFNIQPGDSVTFKVRSFRTTDGEETLDFGDGSPSVTVHSDGNVNMHAEDGYAVAIHQFKKPGNYLVRAERTNKAGIKAVGHVNVFVNEKND